MSTNRAGKTIEKTEETSRAARRDVMRKEGIPTNTFFQATRFDYQHPLITLIASHCFLPTIQEHELTNS